MRVRFVGIKAFRRDPKLTLQPARASKKATFKREVVEL
jgi:hypothetical protein